jgi:hypothetical protein
MDHLWLAAAKQNDAYCLKPTEAMLHRMCMLQCMRRKPLQLPNQYVSVFDADPDLNLINCNLRVLN